MFPHPMSVSLAQLIVICMVLPFFLKRGKVGAQERTARPSHAVHHQLLSGWLTPRCLPSHAPALPQLPVLTMRDYRQWVVPLAVLKLLASVTGQMSAQKIPVSYAHTVKVPAHTAQAEGVKAARAAAALTSFARALPTGHHADLHCVSLALHAEPEAV